MTLIPRQKIWLTIVIFANFVLWVIPSDVVEQIARDRHTMLGRYSRPHFTANIIVGLISLIGLYIDGATGPRYKRRWFQVIATVIALIPTLVVVDLLVRDPETQHFTPDILAYHRPPKKPIRATFEDRPEAFRTYPNTPPGYGKIEATLTTDSRGFRNATALDQYEIVAVGDSFTEGSNVSDEHPWPVKLASLSGASVYNMGMFGYEPLHYLESIKAYGMALKPKHVVCMINEGSDFRSARADEKLIKPSVSKKIDRYIKESPIINAVDNFLIRTFGPIRATAAVRGIEMLDWLPLAIPPGPNAKHYAFAPKQLRDLLLSKEEFAQDKHWLHPRHQLLEMNELCRANGCQLVIVYAPSAAHVLIPLAASRLDAAKVRAFTAISFKHELPPPGEFMMGLLERVDARQTVVAEWCQKETIPFVDITTPLRAAAMQGRQVYYTYDQHWTPEGHEVVAETVAAYLKDHLRVCDTTAPSN